MRKLKFPTFENDLLFLIYKLLYDFLFLLILSFIALLFVKGSLPELLPAYISFMRLTVAIMLTTLAIVQIGRRLEITYAKTQLRKNKLLPFLILLFFLLIGNSLLKFALWENILITLLTLLVFFLFYKILFSAEIK
jgi:phosphatidylglycerophosphate synthase